MLACLGFFGGGFLGRLVFWCLAPLVLVVCIVTGSACHLLARRRLSRATLLQAALPLGLQLLFIMYPIVSRVAFEAYSCVEFDNRTRAYLIAE